MLPLTVPPSDLTRYIPIERVMYTNNEYIGNGSNHLAQEDIYKELHVATETKPDESVKPEEETPNVSFENREYFHETPQRSSTYSDEFVKFQTQSFVKQVKRNLTTWINQGTEDSIPQIAAIKGLLPQYEVYLVQNSETRLLLAGIELVFENNTWENLPIDKVKQLQSAFARFDSEVDMNDIKIFMHDLHTRKISVMTENYDETQNQEQS